MKLYVYAAILVAVLASYAGTYFYGRSAGADTVRLEWEEANRVQRAREATTAAEAGMRLEDHREKDRIVYRTITKSVDKYIDRVELRNVCLDPVGVCLANAAISGTSAAACGTSRTMPASIEAGGWDGSDLATLDRGNSSPVSRLLREAGRAGEGG